MLFFDDIEVGWTREMGKHLFTAEDIKRFASRYDPQPFHMDEEAAKQSHFGKLCASGWHTAAVCMRAIVDSTKQMAAEMIARGEKPAKTGPSPGFTNLKWLKPVYVGDTITFTSEVLEKRETESRPGWGIIRTRFAGKNQNGVPVYQFDGVVFIERRVS
jgi:acyl dehydratase